MKIAIAGKGGSGKTTIAGTLARLYARQGLDVLALDADTNPMLGITLGVGPEKTDLILGVRQAIDDRKIDHAQTSAELVDRFGVPAPDDVRLVVVSRIDNIDPGCP